MNNYISLHEEDLKNIIEFFRRDISSIQTGRANPAMLDSVQVESYGSKVSLQQLANISVVDANCMVVKPWDKGTLKDIEKGIVDADLGLNPVNEGEQVRISIPKPTEEDRINRVKKLNEKLEQAHIKIRQTRDDIKKTIEQAESDKEIAEDDKFRFLKEMEEEIKKRNEELEAIRDKKEKDIMTI
ncbi:MAG: ribosome recycling factor [bacterium]|nr:ribosome recycling factor [bacterium]